MFSFVSKASLVDPTHRLRPLPHMQHELSWRRTGACWRASPSPAASSVSASSLLVLPQSTRSWQNQTLLLLRERKVGLSFQTPFATTSASSACMTRRRSPSRRPFARVMSDPVTVRRGGYPFSSFPQHHCCHAANASFFFGKSKSSGSRRSRPPPMVHLSLPPPCCNRLRLLRKPTPFGQLVNGG